MQEYECLTCGCISLEPLGGECPYCGSDRVIVLGSEPFFEEDDTEWEEAIK